MKCPNDQTEMERGIFVHHMWVSGVDMPGLPGDGLIRKAAFAVGFPGRKKLQPAAYRCSKCGKVELYTKPDQKEEEK